MRLIEFDRAVAADGLSAVQRCPIPDDADGAHRRAAGRAAPTSARDCRAWGRPQACPGDAAARMRSIPLRPPVRSRATGLQRPRAGCRQTGNRHASANSARSEPWRLWALCPAWSAMRSSSQASLSQRTASPLLRCCVASATAWRKPTPAAAKVGASTWPCAPMRTSDQHFGARLARPRSARPAVPGWDGGADGRAAPADRRCCSAQAPVPAWAIRLWAEWAEGWAICRRCVRPRAAHARASCDSGSGRRYRGCAPDGADGRCGGRRE